MRLLLWFYRLVVLVIGLFLVLLNVRLYLPAASDYGTSELAADIPAQLAYLRASLDAGAGEDMQALFPEGDYFMHVLYGLSWTQVGMRAEGELRQQAITEALWALDWLESPQAVAPFPENQAMPNGIFYHGWKSRLRGELLRLTPEDIDQRILYEAEGDHMADTFFASETPYLTSYTRQAWPVDSVVAISALALHDQIYEPRYTGVIQQWVRDASLWDDPLTGLLPHMVDPNTGEARDSARGSSQSVILRFLGDIDPELAAEHYLIFRQEFLDYFISVPGIREHPRGVDGEGDVDSGPLINGLSASATVVSMGAAFQYGDRELGEAWVHVGESAALPFNFGGQKRYVFGALPVTDAFLVWSQTALPLETLPDDFTLPSVVSSFWRVPLHLLSLAVLGLLMIPEWLRRRRKSDL